MDLMSVFFVVNPTSHQPDEGQFVPSGGWREGSEVNCTLARRRGRRVAKSVDKKPLPEGIGPFGGIPDDGGDNLRVAEGAIETDVLFACTHTLRNVNQYIRDGLVW